MRVEISNTVPARAYATLSEWGGASVYHTEQWHQVLAAAFGWRVRALLAHDAGGLCAWLPVVRKRRLGRTVWVALPLSHDCGWVTAPGTELSSLPVGALPRPLEVHGPVPASGFEAVQHHVVTVADPSVHGDEASLMGALDKKKRAEVRKAGRSGVEVAMRTDPAAFDQARAFTVTTRHRQGSPMYPRRFFASLGALMAPAGMCAVHLASHEGRPRAAVVSLQWGATRVYGYGADDGTPEGRRMGVNQAALWDAMSGALADGCDRFDFGSSPAHQDGLIRFKERMGGTTTPLVHALLSRSGRSTDVDQDGPLVRAGVKVLQRAPALPFERLSPALLRMVV